nr:hypothetical protein [uncultured Solibaculum sp.]
MESLGAAHLFLVQKQHGKIGLGLPYSKIKKRAAGVGQRIHSSLFLLKDAKKELGKRTDNPQRRKNQGGAFTAVSHGFAAVVDYLRIFPTPIHLVSLVMLPLRIGFVKSKRKRYLRLCSRRG